MKLKHWGPDFAVRLAHWTGYRRPLLNRLDDPAVQKVQAELSYLAAMYRGQTERLRRGRQGIVDRRKHLRVAATFIEFRVYKNMPRKKALEKTGQRHGRLGDRAIEDSIRFAKGLKDPDGGPWTWWAIANRLARKGKIAQLHRMY
jgi:hypothetical protein